MFRFYTVYICMYSVITLIIILFFYTLIKAIERQNLRKLQKKKKNQLNCVFLYLNVLLLITKLEHFAESLLNKIAKKRGVA